MRRRGDRQPGEDQAGHQLGFLLGGAAGWQTGRSTGPFEIYDFDSLPGAAAEALPPENSPESDVAETRERVPGEFPDPAVVPAMAAQEVADLVQSDQVPVPWAGVGVDEDVVGRVGGHAGAGQSVGAVQARQRQDAQRTAAALGDARYLEPRDFVDVLHQSVYEAIRSLSHATVRSARDRVADVARAADGTISEEHVREMTASCPDPRHGTAYGLRLVQAALYRQVSKRADALSAQAGVPGDERAAVIRTGTDSGPHPSDAGRHLRLVSDALRRHTAAPAPTPATAAQSSAALPARLASSQELREEDVLTALLQEHRESDRILSFLPAAAFTSPGRQEIFRAIGRLRQAGQPVDELTVIWELATASDSSSRNRDNSQVDQGIRAVVTRLASAGGTAQSPSKTARELLSQLDRRTAADRGETRRAQPDQAPVHGSPAATARLPVTPPPEAGGPQPGREPRR